MKSILLIFVSLLIGCSHYPNRSVASDEFPDLNVLNSILIAEKNNGGSYLNNLGIVISRNERADLVSINIEDLLRKEKKLGASKLASDIGVVIKRDVSGKLVGIQLP